MSKHFLKAICLALLIISKSMDLLWDLLHYKLLLNLISTGCFGEPADERTTPDPRKYRTGPLRRLRLRHTVTHFWIWRAFLTRHQLPSKRIPRKILNRLSKTMPSAASLRKKKERLSPSPCMYTASIWGEGKFCLDREFSKNAPYKQKIIFH